MNKSKLAYASTISASVAVVFAVVITISAEFLPAFKNYLKALSGHHWTSKSILTAAIYLVSMILLYVMPLEITGERLQRSFKWLFVVIWLGVVALLGFFTWHYLAI